ncbi:sigma factor regulatory protein, FecR/PupR family [Bacteriovorax sp. BAL6_X]|uniref:FecR domain-containing protein n=1 Tax=Bacteriovorax sp. BAL6_X TaxID=1201290 RepID=UPI000385D4AE|nr:FecR domain-containing protein [Bacteriovorax sp. BAL6_X]EPZ51337.1 sigma factor regulatory protein, FecR/PupR family [Bacteriovorax sp. BAL6_X]
MNLLKLSLILIPLSLFQANAIAAFAKVVNIRGKVSQLPPGAMQASWIKKGQLLKENTSIVTRLRSFVKIEILEDGSYIVVGPNSKIELTKIEKKAGSIIQVLNGKMRSKIVPAKKSKGHSAFNKAYVKTKTMALGVRGTEFVTVVSQENQATSVVTLEGEVAVKKINSESIDPEKTVKDNVDRDDVTIVKKGTASTTYAHLYDEIPPQKVNPNQLIALDKNENLESVKRSDIQLASSKDLSKKEISKLYGNDIDTDEVPKNGAIVDLESAIFIPAIQDETLNIGSVDKNTGQFVAAKGIELDKKKGFVAKKQDEETKEVVKKLNEKIEYKEVQGHEVVDHGPSAGPARLAGMKNSWGLKTGLSIKQMNYANMENNNGSDADNYGGLGADLIGHYRHVLNQQLFLEYILGIHAYFMDRGDLEAEDMDDDILTFELGVQAYYRLNNRFRVTTGFFLNNEMFLTARFENSLTPVMDQRTQFAPYIKFGAEYDYSDNWSFLTGYRSYIVDSSHPNVAIYSGKGFELGARRHLSKSTAVLFNFLHREYIAKDIIVKNKDFSVLYEMEF